LRSRNRLTKEVLGREIWFLMLRWGQQVVKRKGSSMANENPRKLTRLHFRCTFSSPRGLNVVIAYEGQEKLSEPLTAIRNGWLGSGNADRRRSNTHTRARI